MSPPVFLISVATRPAAVGEWSKSPGGWIYCPKDKLPAYLSNLSFLVQSSWLGVG